MIVKDLMTTRVAVIDRQASAEEAFNRMRTQAIHHLVVTDAGVVVGVLSDTDLGGDSWEEVRSGRTIDELLTESPITVAPDDPIETAAETMRNHEFRCLPVVADGELVGIVTSTDLMDLLEGGGPTASQDG